MDKKIRKVVKVKKNLTGDIIEVMMENGDIYSVNDAVVMAKNNLIENMNLDQARTGRDYLTTDDLKGSSISNLPTF